MGVKWTPEQQIALSAKPNILVNAAAGSGKTAVLVERITGMVVRGELDIERVLVVTFTKAAAAEIRARIAASLVKAASKAEGRERARLQNQITMSQGADIVTIDSFCVKVVRNNFHLLDIDPNFSVMDSAESEILKEEAMEELFEELYETEDEDFLRLIDTYATAKSDNGLVSIVRSIYDFTRSQPDPSGWMREHCMDYSGAFSGSRWERFLLGERDRLIESAVLGYRELIGEMLAEVTGWSGDADSVLDKYPPDSTEMTKALKKCWTAARSEYEALKNFSGTGWDELVSISFIATRKGKDETVNYFLDKLKPLREKVKRAAEVTFPSSAEADMSMRMIYPDICALTELTEKFTEKYNEKKRKRNILEFSDIEHMALKVFSGFPDTAEEYREKYDEILMDEYQDTNSLQEAIFSAIAKERNTFLVGDMKQSIYRFRNSDPLIFKTKNDIYEKSEDAVNRKVILSKNFRSRKEILDGVNDLFTDIMREGTGEVEYDEDQKLNLGDESYRHENDPESYIPEFCLIEGATKEDEEEEIETTRLEARFVANRIRRLKEEGFLVRDKSGEYRPVENRDITILSSAVRSMDHIYLEELETAGIDSYAESRGYFEKSEIKLMTSLLKIISNPQQDIPLIGVLRSPVANFTDEELAEIRMKKNGCFYFALEEAAKDNGSLGAKCAGFLENLSRWRGYTRFMPSDRLIWTLYQETDFYNFAGTYYGGEESQANLQLLFTRAKLYEKSGFKGLFNFIRYIERLESSSQDLSGANLIGEGHNAVRIMTIHKSKGLEFPVVFLVGTGKRFRFDNSSAGIVMHKDWGFGMRLVTREYVMETAMERVVRAVIRREQLAEEMRKLYVALTRAKEKLIVSGVVSGKTDGMDKFLEAWNKEQSEDDIMSAVRFMDWLGPVAIRSRNWIFKTFDFAAASQMNTAEKEPEPETELSEETKKALYRILEYKYPYEKSSDIPTKISVTGIKRFLQNTADIPGEDDVILEKLDYQPDFSRSDMADKPSFLKEESKPKGAALGTVYHTVMANYIIGKDAVSELERMESEGIISSQEKEAIKPEWIEGFFRSDIGKRMAKAKSVHRETPFEMEIDSKELGEEYSGERIILQGIIDCWFEEEDGIVLIDYKTDRYTDPAEIKGRYAMQLDYYRRAIERVAKKSVKNSYLYLFYGQDVI